MFRRRLCSALVAVAVAALALSSAASANECQCLCCPGAKEECLNSRRVDGCVDCDAEQCRRWFPLCEENPQEVEATCVKTDSGFNRFSVYLFITLASGMVLLALSKEHVPLLRRNIRTYAQSHQQ